ncbi:MAG: hypothetical protein QME81_00615 [bacterium]|nr:hypothetical protein [bacterium]
MSAKMEFHSQQEVKRVEQGKIFQGGWNALSISVFWVVITVSIMAWTSLGRAASQTEVREAINDGLSYLASIQNADGSWGSTSYKLAETAEIVLAFENRNYPCAVNPYAENIQDGLDYIFTRAYTRSISQQTYGNPDTDGDGIGVYFSMTSHMYETGIVMTAIVGSNTPDSVVTTGNLADRTYKEVLTDCVDYLAWAQCDGGSGRGGWRYSAYNNTSGSSDNSVSQWPALGLIGAEMWGINAPAFVKSELNRWIDYIQNDSSGGSGYTSPTYWVNVAKTGGLLQEMHYYGDTKETNRVQQAANFINNNWNTDNKGNYYAMYSAFKGLKLLSISDIPLPNGTFDWYDDYTTYLISAQNANGTWPSGSGYGGSLLSTAWALLILEGTVFPEVVTRIQAIDSPNDFGGSLTVNWEQG